MLIENHALEKTDFQDNEKFISPSVHTVNGIESSSKETSPTNKNEQVLNTFHDVESEKILHDKNVSNKLPAPAVLEKHFAVEFHTTLLCMRK